MDKGEKWEIFRALGQLTQLGLTMATCVLMGVLAGRFADSRLGTSPWGLLILAFMGAAAAFKVLYDTVIKRWMKK